jgi:hypothetical protein
MMQYVVAKGMESVMSWVLGGRGFKIHDPDKLVEILSLFFGQTKYASFRRQLKMWDFERIVHGPNKGTFMHPYFVGGNRALCASMSRLVSPRGDHGSRRSSISMKENLGSLKSEFKDSTIPLSRGIPKQTPNLDSAHKSEGPEKSQDAASAMKRTPPQAEALHVSTTTPNAINNAYRRRKKVDNTTENLDSSCHSEDSANASISTFAWSSPSAYRLATKEALVPDMEPSRIFAPSSRNSTASMIVTRNINGMKLSSHNGKEDAMKHDLSFLHGEDQLFQLQCNWPPNEPTFGETIDYELSALLKNDDDEGSIAGKSFSSVESSSHE